MTYKKITKPDLKPHLPSRCGIAGCPNGPDVMVVTKKGVQVSRCAHHYMMDIDRYRGSATSDVLIQQMKTEVEEQKEIGKEAYRRESMERMKAFIGGIGGRHD